MIDIIMIAIFMSLLTMVYLKLTRENTGVFDSGTEESESPSNLILSGSKEAYDPAEDPHKILLGENETYFD